MLARLRIAAYTGQLPSDVGEWACQTLDRARRRTQLKLERDEHLARAARLLTGSRWQRVNALSEMIEQLRGRDPDNLPPFGVTWFVASALKLDPITPSSARHLLRLID
jgi:hypothetical protein